MKPTDKGKTQLADALQDPDLSLDPAVLSAATPEQQRDLASHRILDTRLSQAFSELAAHVDAKALDEKVFRARLSEGIRAAQADAAAGKRAPKLTGVGESLRDWFDFSSMAPHRWAPALILLLLLPALPLILQVKNDERSVAEAPGEDLALSSKSSAARSETAEGALPSPAPDRVKPAVSPKKRRGPGGAPATPSSGSAEPMLSSPPFDRSPAVEQEKSDDGSKRTKARESARERAGDVPAPTVAQTRPASPTEAELEAALGRAKSNEEKRRILRELAELHRKSGQTAKRTRAESRLRALSQ